jgi:hypothetical protein
MTNPSISDQRPRVFVTQEAPQLNFTPAEQFGDVVFLTRDDFSPVAGSLNNHALQLEIEAKLAHFDPARDFLCFAGSPTVAAYAFMTLGRLNRRDVRLLRWSNRDRQYYVVHLDR